MEDWVAYALGVTGILASIGSGFLGITWAKRDTRRLVKELVHYMVDIVNMAEVARAGGGKVVVREDDITKALLAKAEQRKSHTTDSELKGSNSTYDKKEK